MAATRTPTEPRVRTLLRARTQIEPIAGRRPMAAGHVILVVVVALIIGTVLNAPGLYKTARTQPQGWKRTVAVVVMTPVKWVSVHSGLSLPREFLQSATGQSGADEINTYVPDPVAASTPTLVTTTTTAKPVATPFNKVRIWVAGDSLAVTPGQSILRRADSAVTDIRGIDGRVSTGLARPDVFNWFTHVKAETARTNAQVVVLTFGANDDQYLVGGPGGRSVGPFGSDAWKEEYRRRVGAMMDQVISEGRKVIWTGVPIVRNDERSLRYSELNAIYRDEASKRVGNAVFVDTWPLFVDQSGVYADDLMIVGAIQRVRAPDGIHFTRVGGDLIADAQVRALNSLWDLTSGRDATPPTTAPPPTTVVAPSASTPR